jgi:hypothetical protein
MAAIETVTSVLTARGASIAATGRVLDYEPVAWTDSLDWNVRAGKLRETYGKRGAMAKSWDEIPPSVIDSLSPGKMRECQELIRLGMERKAIRLAYCRKLAHVYGCEKCGRPAKKISNCKNRMCSDCAAKNFDALFRKFAKLDSMIPASVRSQAGCGWYVLDFSFKHDGDFPKRRELRAMVGIIRRTVQRAIYERRSDLMDARKGCRLRLNEDGTPMISPDGWPVAGAPDGEARELVGWMVIRHEAHKAPDNAARRRGIRGAKKDIPARYELRFGFDLLRVTEFGFDSVNAHFHCAYFGPRLDYWKRKDSGHLVCGGALVEIFKQESAAPVDRKHPSRGGLGEQSYTVFFEEAKRGFRSVLAHALKYTKKIPTSTPEGYARLESALQGTRRVALLGMHYGVPLKPEPRSTKCPSCGGKLERVKNVGLVLLSDVADLSDAVEGRSVEDAEVLDAEADFGFDEEGRAP